MQFSDQGMRRLVTAGLLPDRAGQPVKAWVHMSLADLMLLDGSSALLEEWTSRVRAQWAGHRAEASAGGSDGGAWLDGDAAEAVACGAAMAPFVTGEADGLLAKGRHVHDEFPVVRTVAAEVDQPGTIPAAAVRPTIDITMVLPRRDRPHHT